jgi:methionyl-tRNA formyltransferase
MTQVLSTYPRIAVMGAGEFIARTLQTLCTHGISQVCAVVPRKNTVTGDLDNSRALEEVARSFRLKIIDTTDVNDASFIKVLKNTSPDLIVNWGINQIFKGELLSCAPLGVVNFHPGLIPNGRGCQPVEGEIWNEQTRIGQVVHFMSEDIDKGHIINSRSFKLNGEETGEQVDKLLEEGVVEFFLDGIYEALRGTVGIEVNDFGRYYPAFVEGDDLINWHQTSDHLLRRVRSRSHYMPSRCIKNPEGIEVFVTQVSKAEVNPYFSPEGQVIDRSPSKGNLVKTGDTAIWIERVSYDGKNYFIPQFSIGTSFMTINLNELLKLRKSVDELKLQLETYKATLK